MKALFKYLWGLTKAAVWTALFVGGAVGVCLLAAWLTVNRHFTDSEVVVPAITGLGIEEAEAILLASDLELRIEARRPNESVAAGEIYYQEPRPKAQTRRKRHVRAWLSTGPLRMEVPDLSMQSGRAAILNLGQLGLGSGEIVRVHSPRVEGNAVLAQEPAAGSSVPDDARVHLLISQGPRRLAWVMPDLRGRSLAEVELAFAGTGLRLAEVRESAVPGVEGGRIAFQEPPAGSRVTGESVISLTIARVVELAPSGFDRDRAPRVFTR